MPKSLNVFLCSTFEDLSEERSAVLEALRLLELRYDGMEVFGAHDEEPLAVCLERVQRSNLLVVVVGHLYGAMATERGMSFSQAEYIEARRVGKQCIIYFRDDEIPVLPRYFETDPQKLRLLNEWKAHLREKHTVATFKTAEDLAGKVTSDLRRKIEHLHLEQVAASTRIFLVYASDDAEFVEGFRKDLEAIGVDRITDESEAYYWAGQDDQGFNYSEQDVERAIKESGCVVVFVSQALVRNESAMRVVNIGLDGQRAGRQMVSLITDDADVPNLLRSIQAIDVRDRDKRRAVRYLMDAIKQFRRAKSPSW
jgi:hypothetical protein